MSITKGKSVLKKFIILLGISLLIFLLGFFPMAVLKYYSMGIYPYLSSALRFISSIFPFALGDIMYVLLVAWILYRTFIFFKNRKSLKKAHRIIVPVQLLNFFLILYLVFKIVWGLNYSRPSMAAQLNIKNDKYSVRELVLLGNYFVKKTNSLKLRQKEIPNYTIKELEKHAVEAYKTMATKNALFNYPSPCLKPVLSSWLTSKVGIEGYYAPLTAEANLNTYMPNFVKPYIACHEIAHQLGVAYEDEANLVGYLAASNSSNLHYQYSANYEMLRYILLEIALKSPDDYKNLKLQLTAGILDDFNAEKKFWSQYNSEMSKYFGATFDQFLKLNNQKKGINSYQDIVIWLWNLHKNDIEAQR